MTRRPILATAAAAAALLVAGCTGDTEPDPTPSSSETASESASPAPIPETPLGTATQAGIDILNGDIALDAAMVDERFEPSIVEASGGAAALAASLATLVAVGPYTFDGYTETDDGAVAILLAGEDRWALNVAIDANGLYTGFLMQPAPEYRPATSWAELDERVQEAPEQTRLVVLPVVDGELGAPEHELSSGDVPADQALPSGSMVKLFVLLAVTQAVADGELTWDTPLTLTDELRSLPSGELQNEPTGTQVTVQQAAQGMIAISDNTATDLLIAAVGPDAVLEQMRELGAEAGEGPLLTTRQLFQLAWGPDASLRERWRDGDPQQRQLVLDEIDAQGLTVTTTEVTTPQWQNGVDWFFTATDLAAVHVALHAAAQEESGAPLTEILTTNPGLELGTDWDQIAFKGGSSIGVLGGSWLLEREGGTWVVILQSATADPTAFFDQQNVLYLAADAATLLAQP